MEQFHLSWSVSIDDSVFDDDRERMKDVINKGMTENKVGDADIGNCCVLN
jgi:DNA-binding protein YbaB